jgi:hypothetical protein
VKISQFDAVLLLSYRNCEQKTANPSCGERYCVGDKILNSNDLIIDTAVLALRSLNIWIPQVDVAQIELEKYDA